MSFGGGRRKWSEYDESLFSLVSFHSDTLEENIVKIGFLSSSPPSLVVIILNFKALLLRLLPPNRKELHNPLLLAFFLHPSVCFSAASFSAHTETHTSSLATFTKNAGKKDQMQKCRTSGRGGGGQDSRLVFKVCLQIFKPAGRRRCQFKFRKLEMGNLVLWGFHHCSLSSY